MALILTPASRRRSVDRKTVGTVDSLDEARRRVADSISIRSGRVTPGLLTAVSIMRNERYLLPAFLNHYRSLGVEQFLIVSDRSDDGTDEYLKSQADCVLITSTLTYGSVIGPADVPVRKRWRTGVLMKGLLLDMFCGDEVALYVDADEFMILPPKLDSLEQVMTAMRSERSGALYASMVEMYPAAISDLRGESRSPTSLDDLLGVAPFFDGRALIDFDHEDQLLSVVGRSATSRLFRRYGIGARKPLFDALPRGLRRLATRPMLEPAVYKTPIIDLKSGARLVDSHEASGAIYSGALVALLHFKFTPDTFRKVDDSIAVGGHYRGSLKYRRYRQLFVEMGLRGRFTDRRSVGFEGPESLAAYGLVRGFSAGGSHASAPHSAA